MTQKRHDERSRPFAGAAHAVAGPAVAASCAVLGAVLAIGSHVRAEPVDPALPEVVTVGAAATPAGLDRLDVQRRNHSRVALPGTFVEVERKTLGTMGHAPVVHPDGTITVALSSPELVRLAADGTETSRVPLGASAAVCAPVVLPNGSLAVLTGAPSIVFVSASGKVTATLALPRAAFSVSPSSALGEPTASLTPTEDGAVVVAANRALIEIDASSRVRAKVTLPERIVGDVLPHSDDWLVVGESGGVYRIAPPAEPRKLGTIGTIVPGTVALVDDRTLVAQSPPNRLIAFDLKSGTSVTRVGDSIFTLFDAAAAYDAKGNAWLTTIEGFLVGYDPAGAELARLPADRTATLATPAFLPPPRHGRIPMNSFGFRPSPVVDDAGRVAFARPNGRFGIRNTDGKVTTTDRACNTPLAIVPLSPGKLMLACRDGSLIFYEEPSSKGTTKGPTKESTKGTSKGSSSED